MFWNKIEVNRNIILDSNSPYYLEVSNDVILNVTVNHDITSKLVIIANNNYEVNIVLEKGSNLIVNSINKDNNANVNIKLCENTNITYNHSSLAKMNSINNFNIIHLSNDSISNLNNNGINTGNGKLFFTINGCISKKLENITCNQKSKIIEFSDGNSKIIPNLIIDSNDIVASHSAFIGKIDDEVKFYLKSRGIGEEDILKMIYKTTLLGTMELENEEDEFNKRINEWW